jgi:hypothetical protein
LYEQVFDLFAEAAPEGGEGVVIGGRLQAR